MADDRPSGWIRDDLVPGRPGQAKPSQACTAGPAACSCGRWLDVCVNVLHGLSLYRPNQIVKSNLTSETQAPDRVVSCRVVSCHVVPCRAMYVLTERGSCQWGTRMPQNQNKSKNWPIVQPRLDDTRHVRLFVRRPTRRKISACTVPYTGPSSPLSFIQGDQRGEREGKRARARARAKKIHAEDGSFAVPAPGVRERLRISFNSVQRLTRAASESPPPPPPSVVGGWDTTLRAVGLGGGDGSRRFAPLRWV